MAALLLAALAAPALGPDDGVALPPQRRGGVEARLAVRVDPSTTAQHARLTLKLEVEGPPLLEVRPPVLSDAQEAGAEERAPLVAGLVGLFGTLAVRQAHSWEVERVAWCELKEGRLTWTQVLTVQQLRPGRVPPPALSVAFREKPGAAEQRVDWTDVLREPRERLTLEEPPPEAAPAPASWPIAAAVGAAAAVAVLSLLVLGWALRRRTARPPPPSPEQTALRELERVEEQQGGGAGDAGWFFAHLSAILRRYFAERCGLPAARRTTPEFLDALAAAPPPGLTPEQLERLGALLRRCDQVRFARSDAPPDERRQAAALVRELVSQPSAPSPPAPPPA
jgi:hypothetical protein